MRIAPNVSPDLPAATREAFPDRLPEEQISEFALGRLVGRQDVVRWLERQVREQQTE